MKIGTLSIWTVAAALACIGVSPPARAAYVTTKHTFTAYGVIWVPQNTWQINFTVKGGSGGAPSSGTTHERSKGGRGAEITFSLAYGHGYKASDVLLIHPGGDSLMIKKLMHGGGSGKLQVEGGDGLWGGNGSGVYNLTQGRWLVIAGGGGGAGGQLYENGGNGGDAGHPGRAGLVFGQPAGGAGGAAGAPCSTPPSVADNMGAGENGHDANKHGGGGGGGGGGCHGGAGGGTGTALAGGGGGGGSNYVYGEATHLTQGLAPAGPGSVTVSIVTYSEPPPQIVSPDKAVFVVGQPACFDVATIGSPPPEVHMPNGTPFPDGITFNVPFFSGTGQFRGTPASASIGTYPIPVTIRNDWGHASQTLTIEVVAPEHAPANPNLCHP